MLIDVRNNVRKSLLILSSLKFAILVLLIIASFSILGTVIEQNQTFEFYKQNYPENTPLFGLINWKTIKFLNLDNVYKSWWYLTLLIILGSSLILCTFNQQLPILKTSKNWRFFNKKSQFKKLDLKLELEQTNFENFAYILNKETYNIFQYKKSFFCYKGIIGRISPIIVHISIIQIFIGAIIGAFFGFAGQEIIPNGENSHLQNILNSGNFSSIPNGISARVNNFWIDYKKESANNSINQFYSDISLLDSRGKELKRKVISVNNPFHYKNITIYQSDWDISCIRLKNEEGKIIQYQTKKINVNGNNRWLVKLKLKEDEFNILLKDLKKEIVFYDKNGKFLQNLSEGKIIETPSTNLILHEIVASTGLDIKSDPGIPFVYIGFVSLIFSTLLSFVSFSKIWIFGKSNNIYIGASSNRAKKAFEKYFLEKIAETY